MKKEETWWLINAHTNIEPLFDSVREQMNLVFDAFDVFSDKETAIQMILDGTADKYSDTKIMHYDTAKLLAEMGYSDQVYERIKDSKAEYLVKLSRTLSSPSRL